MTAPLAIPEAAAELGIPPGTLRRWVREGCPVAQRGRRGRGLAVLVSVPDVRAWRAADPCESQLLTLADELPHVLAGAAWQALCQVEGADKRRVAGLVAAFWFVTTTAALDHLRTKCPEIPELRCVPETIERLQKIARS